MTTASEAIRAGTPQAFPAPHAAPTPASSGSAPRLLLCALSTSALLYLCFFPVAWGFLAWVALVPLLGLVRSGARPRVIYWSAYLSGAAFYFAAVQWMRVADPRMYFTWIILSVYCAAYFPLAIFFIRKLDRGTGLPLTLTAPVVWIGLAYIRANLGGGFPWYLLGYSQHQFGTLIQIADLTGVYGISFLLVAVNALLLGWLSRLKAVRWFIATSEEAAPSGPPALAAQAALLLLVFTGCLIYGSWRIGQYEPQPGPRLALIQGNVPQQIRNARNSPDASEREKAAGNMTAHYGNLSEAAARLAHPVHQRPHLIVWPETSFPGEYEIVVADRPLEKLPGHLQRDLTSSWEMMGKVARRYRTHVLLGLNVTVRRPDGGRPRRFNSALLVGPDSTRPDGWVLGRYDKIHRVPFGEYVPFRDSIPLMARFAPYDFDYSVTAGEQQTRLPLGDFRFGVVICYEDTDHNLARGYVAPGRDEKVDFVVNISNDGWFDGTAEHEEHLAICRFRAIECRRSVVRSVNMGISAVIDGNGRVLAPEVVGNVGGALLWEVKDAASAEELPVARWGEFKKVPGVLFATVPLDLRESFYAAWGDWLPLGSLVCLAVVLLILVRRRATA
jgi:apolipoprotein N-acyltransferase